MYPTTALIPHLSSLPAYGAYSAVLVNNWCETIWKCTHAHYSITTALECAEYEKNSKGA